jgi:tRNA (guanine37-N1)-methyltransferase
VAKRDSIRFSVISLFPDFIREGMKVGLVGQAVDRGAVALEVFNPRDETTDVHHKVDDRPFGGGDGMVMILDPWVAALKKATTSSDQDSGLRVIHLSPRGTPLNDKKVRELSSYQHLILVATRYAGMDQRFLNEFVDEEISIGDFVVSGGETPALLLMDAVVRQIPGVLSNSQSVERESFVTGRLEAPQFTRPRESHWGTIPEALLSGDHQRIQRWHLAMGLLVTMVNRPDLLTQQPISREELCAGRAVLASEPEADLESCGLPSRVVLESLLDRWSSPSSTDRRLASVAGCGQEPGR